MHRKKAVCIFQIELVLRRFWKGEKGDSNHFWGRSNVFEGREMIKRLQSMK